MKQPLNLATLGERVNNLERIAKEHAADLASIMAALKDLHTIEKERQISEAVAAERAVGRGKQLERIEIDIASFKSTVSKLLWIVVGSLVLAFLNWIYKGGLAP